MFWSDLVSKLILMLSRVAHSTYFKLADKETSFSYGYEFMNVALLTNAPPSPPPEVKFKHDIEYINASK